ncbi:MAG: polysulfide reductase, partial [Chloroflexota bacterium]|nr:polysulfide reductase [Chloroflexota bacterium]
APLALQAPGVLRGRAPSRPTTALASALTLAGGLIFRYVILYAGRRSADDSQATFALAGAGRQGDERAGG